MHVQTLTHSSVRDNFAKDVRFSFLCFVTSPDSDISDDSRWMQSGNTRATGRQLDARQLPLEELGPE